MNPAMNYSWIRGVRGYSSLDWPYLQHPHSEPEGGSFQEELVDMFMLWILNDFEPESAGTARNDWIHKYGKLGPRSF